MTLEVYGRAGNKHDAAFGPETYWVYAVELTRLELTLILHSGVVCEVFNKFTLLSLKDFDTAIVLRHESKH